MKHKTGILIGLISMSIVLLITGIGAYFILFQKKEPTTPHIRLKQTMNIKIYHPDWQFQNGKIIEIEEQQKYETYYKALLEQEKAEVYRGNTLTDFEKNQPKRFVVPSRGSKSKKFTFGFNTDTHANRNVYWELGNF